MITLDQIRTLEKKVHAAVSRIADLKHENSVLKEKLESYEQRISELEAKISDFKQDQSEIEQGILSALDQLDQLEDEVLDGAAGDAHESASGSASPGGTPDAGALGLTPGETGAQEQAPAPPHARSTEVEQQPAEHAPEDPPDAPTGEPHSGEESSDEEKSEDRGELDIF